jgi:hypothetical protein
MRAHKIQRTILRLFLLSLFFFTFQAVAFAEPNSSETSNDLDRLDLKKAPTPEGWQTFLKSPMPLFQAYIIKNHMNNKDQLIYDRISWQWRMGLVRKCRESNEEFCRRQLVSSLDDPALVVRNESVGVFAARYSQSGDSKALSILEHAFSNPKNFRAGKPLFVQRKILFAIHEIGGIEAKALGHRLSKVDSNLKVYWSKL